MADIALFEVGDLDMGKHAYAQLREYFEDIRKNDLTEVTEVPWKLDSELQQADGAIVLVDLSEASFAEQAVKKILDIETERKKPVQKVFVEKKKENREAFRDRAHRRARENAEKLAEKLEATENRIEDEEV